ncbi:MAG: hypothetical protein LBP19_08790 [Treponema sp.]|nr:hypothetical protein [Treponema sp.]
MLDTTQVNDEVTSFITGTFIRNYLKFGDTFHLISFNDTASIAMIRRIMGNDDLNAISAALPPYRMSSAASNPLGALAFAATYIASLTNARSKKALLLTNAPNTQSIVSEAKTRFSAMHVSLEWINLLAALQSIPIAEQSEPPTRNVPQPPAQQLELEPPEQNEPEPPQSAAPDTVWSQPTVIVPQAPDDIQSITIQPSKQKSGGQSNSDSRYPQTTRPKIAFRIIPHVSTKIGAIVLAIFFFMALLLLFLFRHVLYSLDRTFFLICSQKAVEPAFLSLFVEDQNTNIGRRNTHTIGTGYALTLGGGNSDFLIFLVPLPQNIATIRFDGNECVFIPQKRQFFPELNGNMLPNCTGKTIKIRSKRNYDLFIRIMRHEAPYKKLRSLFQSIRLPAQFARG